METPKMPPFHPNVSIKTQKDRHHPIKVRRIPKVAEWNDLCFQYCRLWSAVEPDCRPKVVPTSAEQVETQIIAV